MNPSTNPSVGTAAVTPPGSMASPLPVARGTEVRGLRLAQAAAATGFLGLMIAWLGPITLIFASGVEIHYRGFHVGSGMATVAGFENILIVIVLGGLLILASIVLYLISFNTFRKVSPGFGGPVTLVILGLIGVLFIVLGFALVLSDFYRAVACAAAGASSSCLDLAQLAGAVLTIFLGFILAVLGWIGLVLGLYRIGKRYGSTITIVGAILTIIPFAGLVAPILVIIGTHQSVHQLQAQDPTRT
ncbi:MAG: DUF973 family protein [Thermoplasmata archaeon]|nr:DUF973 family protein [Thermoplasmata archaeon]